MSSRTTQHCPGLRRGAVLALSLVLVIIAPRLPTRDVQAQAGPQQRSAKVYLPIVGQYTRGELAAPVDRGWQYYGETNRVLDVAVDPRTGAIWAATAGGLVRRDPNGDHSTRMSLLPLRHVAVDTAGAVWVGGYVDYLERVSRLGPDGTWRHYGAADGLATGHLADIVADGGGNVWVAYATVHWRDNVPQNGGLSRISPDGLVRTFGIADGWPSQSLSSIVPDRSGGVWFGLGDPDFSPDPLGVGHVTGAGETQFDSAANGLPVFFLQLQTTDAAGVLYAIPSPVPTELLEPVVYRRSLVGQWAPMALPEEVTRWGLMVTLVAVDPSGNLWIALDWMHFLIRIRLDGTSQQVPDDLSPDDEASWRVREAMRECHSLAFGRDGSVLVASEFNAEGLVRLDSEDRWHIHGDRDGSVPGSGHHITVDRHGDTWLATGGYYNGGMYRLSSSADYGWQRETSHYHDSSAPLAVDRAGNVWVAGDWGTVWRLPADGGVRQTFTAADGVPAAEVYVIAVSPGGTVWLGTGGAGASYLRQDGRWVTLTPANGLAGNSVSAIAFDDQGGTWLGSSAGVNYIPLSGQILSSDTDARLATEGITRLAVAPSGDLWVGTIKGLLQRTSDGVWSAIDLPAGSAPARVWAIAFDKAGNAWIGRQGAALLRQAPEGTWTEWTEADGLSGPAVRDILVDDAGNVWLAADWDWSQRDDEGDLGGLHRVAPDGAWTTFRLPKVPGDNLTRSHRGLVSLAMDAEGRILCGTWGNQLMRLEANGTFTTLIVQDGLPAEDIRDLTTDAAGTVWAATSDGLARWTAATRWRTFHTADGLPVGSIAALATDRAGDLWVGTDPAWLADKGTWRSTGVTRVSPDGVVTGGIELPDQVSGSGVHAMAWEPDGSLWLATHTLVDRYKNGQVERSGTGVSRRAADGAWSQLSAAGGFLSDDVRAIAVDGHGDSWFATSAGLAQRTPGGEWVNFTTVNGLVSNNVSALGVDGAGRLMLTTDAGVQLRTGVGGWRTWSTANGLSDGKVLDLAFDRAGRVWLATYLGGITVMPPIDR